MSRRLAALGLGLALAGAGLALDRGWLDGPLDRLATATHQARPPAPTVVFVVLDTVRADRLSACGYARPTTPTLEALVDKGASLSCRAYAPGAWTLPSHASFFTGLPVQAHAVGAAGADGRVSGAVQRMAGRETLATRFAARGYQTVSISGNPLIQAGSGLVEGFRRVHISGEGGALLNERHTEVLEELLRGGLAPDRPLFLFLNFYEAHDAWDAVPEGVGWVPPRPRLELGRPEHAQALHGRFLSGAMDAEERARTLAWLNDVYDYGVARADAGLGRALAALEAHGWTSAGLRLVVTSDHGEHLGEQGRLWHGGAVWEANQRVPLLVYDSAGPAPALEEPMAALEAHALVLDGRRPEPPLPVSAAVLGDGGPANVIPPATVAVWEGWRKEAIVDGEGAAFDLAVDPAEARPAPDPAPIARAVEAALAAEVAAQGTGEVDPALLEALRAAGYMD